MKDGEGMDEEFELMNHFLALVMLEGRTLIHTSGMISKRNWRTLGPSRSRLTCGAAPQISMHQGRSRTCGRVGSRILAAQNGPSRKANQSPP